MHESGVYGMISGIGKKEERTHKMEVETMKLSRLLERLEYEVVQGSAETEVETLINDSRKAAPGAVFVCISGAVSDGHAYAKEVAEKGAAALMVEK